MQMDITAVSNREGFRPETVLDVRHCTALNRAMYI
jgi:hypothetical protein